MGQLHQCEKTFIYIQGRTSQGRQSWTIRRTKRCMPCGQIAILVWESYWIF